MKSSIVFAPVLAVSIASSVLAQGVYLCSQPNGTREYRNTGDTRGCRKLELEAISTIPSTSSSSSQAKFDASGEAFPKIESQVQKRRDQDRMQILLDEVRTEEGKLAELKKEFQNGEPERQGGERNYAKYQDRVAMMKEEMQRTEKNIESLRREISQLK
jgi:chromosome segregation ATPase